MSCIQKSRPMSGCKYTSSFWTLTETLVSPHLIFLTLPAHPSLTYPTLKLLKLLSQKRTTYLGLPPAWLTVRMQTGFDLCQRPCTWTLPYPALPLEKSASPVHRWTNWQAWCSESVPLLDGRFWTRPGHDLYLLRSPDTESWQLRAGERSEFQE